MTKYNDFKLNSTDNNLDLDATSAAFLAAFADDSEADYIADFFNSDDATKPAPKVDAIDAFFNN